MRRRLLNMIGMEDEEVKEWRQIADITLESEQNIVIIETDMNGANFELEEIMLHIVIESNESTVASSYTRLGINKNNVNDFIVQGNDSGVPSSGKKYIRAEMKRIGDCKWSWTTFMVSQSTLLRPGSCYGMDENEITDKAKAIVINFMGNAGVGTQIRAYGR